MPPFGPPVRSTPTDLDGWRDLAREVEDLFGAPMADDPTWNGHLERAMARGDAWCVHDVSGRVVGAMWLSPPTDERLHIRWLAVCAETRRHGVGHALVEVALAEAHGRAVRVVTFGTGHPAGTEADAARRLYGAMGFSPVHERPGDVPDGTPREVLSHEAQSDQP